MECLVYARPRPIAYLVPSTYEGYDIISASEYTPQLNPQGRLVIVSKVSNTSSLNIQS